jgi:lysozyme family protein
MKSNYETCIALVLKHEGGYVNNPKDPGGATNLGVTKKVWEEWVGKPVSLDEMKALTVKDVTPLYKAQYWDRVRGDDLPAGVDYAVMDVAVNSGVVRAAKFLQAALGLTADGIIGPATLAAAEAANPRQLVTDVCDKRLAFMQALPIWSTFGNGWSRRVKEVEEKAFEMASV